MKKLIICSLLLAFTFSMFGQVTVSGRGIPADPYILKWRVTNVDTTFASPTNAVSPGVTKNYVFVWQVHYSGLTGSTGKIYPLTAASVADTLQTIPIDTTNSVCLLLMTDPVKWRNRQFIGGYLSTPALWWHYSKGSNTAGGWIWIYQVFKPLY